MPQQYLTVPFQGSIKAGKHDPTHVADQLQDLLNHYAPDGWELDQVSSITVEIKSGCLPLLFGHKLEYTRHDIVIFRREY